VVPDDGGNQLAVTLPPALFVIERDLGESKFGSVSFPQI